MLDFLDSDWFIIGMEIIFVILISYDLKQYFITKKREYVVNIVLTIGFAVWTLYPMYNSYFGWNDLQKKDMFQNCKDSNNTKLCKCVDDLTFKEFIYEEYKSVDKNSTEYKEFIKESKEDCLDDSWF